MAKKDSKVRVVTLSLKFSYAFEGELLKEYKDWLNDSRDSKRARKWFVIDRAIGHEYDRLNSIVDPAFRVEVVEEETVA